MLFLHPVITPIGAILGGIAAVTIILLMCGLFLALIIVRVRKYRQKKRHIGNDGFISLVIRNHCCYLN